MICNDCLQSFQDDEFYLNGRDRQGRQRRASYCRSCHHNRTRRAHYLRRYGITPEDYEQMLEAQEGVCAICFEAPASGKRLHVDHDHETGEVRGLLCFSCNTALGRIGDSLEGFVPFIVYLSRDSETEYGTLSTDIESTLRSR